MKTTRTIQTYQIYILNKLRFCHYNKYSYVLKNIPENSNKESSYIK